MSIKIINVEPDGSVVKRCVCHNCGATLEYTPADTRKITRRDYTGDSDTYTVIDCPKCQWIIEL